MNAKAKDGGSKEIEWAVEMEMASKASVYDKKKRKKEKKMIRSRSN